MKITITVPKEVDIKTLSVKANVRYWEDATVNDVIDTEGKLIPCRVGGLWCPIIDIDSGIITNWAIGTTATVHYKVCDEGSYYLSDEHGNDVFKIENNYVPSIMCPTGGGYGDYIKMTIDKNGQIQNWVAADLNDFTQEN